MEAFASLFEWNEPEITDLLSLHRPQFRTLCVIKDTLERNTEKRRIHHPKTLL